MQTKTVIGIIFWVLLAAFVVPGVMFGFQKLFGHPQKNESPKHWGYSIMFMRFLRFGEITALAILLFTQLRYLGVVFFCIILACAIYDQIQDKGMHPNKRA